MSKPARNGGGFLGLIWLMGLAIFILPFLLLNSGSGALYAVALGIAWTIGAIAFWIKVGAARELARWESLQEARKEGRKEGSE